MDVDPLEAPGPVPKRAHKKSRNGCKNCKARKVKCDETRPLCNNCRRHYANITACEWESSPPSRTSVLSSRPSRRRRPSAAVFELGSFAESSNAAQRSRRPQADFNPGVFGLELLDPFATHPNSQISDIDWLLRNYLANFVFRCFPFFNTPSIVKIWWPFARDDVVLFHVILELSALHPASATPPPNSTRARQAKEVMAECLRLLKDRLEDPDLRASDQTIAAVANLLAIEHSRGNIKAVKSHLSGLRLMLQLRHGLDSVKASNPIVADIVHWTAMAIADDPLQIPFEFERSDDPAPWLRVVSDPTRYDFKQLELGEVFEASMTDVDALSQRFSVIVTNPSSEESVAVVDALALIIQRLLRLQLPQDRDFAILALGDSCRYAAALHIFSPLGGYYPDSTLMTSALMHKLKFSLSIVLDSERSSDYLVMWLLYVGGITAASLPERHWFIGHIAAISEDLGIETWPQAEKALTYIMWHAIFCESVFGQIWLEVQNKRQNLTGPDD